MTIHSEIEFQNPDGTWIHSDTCPSKCRFDNLNDEHREYLHRILDEWIDNSRGTGGFYVKNEQHVFVFAEPSENLPVTQIKG